MYTPFAHGVAQSMSTDAQVYHEIPPPSIMPADKDPSYRIHLSSFERSSGTVQRAQYIVDLMSPDHVVKAGKCSVQVESFHFGNHLGTLPPGASFRVRLEELPDSRSYSSKTQGLSTTIYSGIIPTGPDTVSRQYPPIALTGETSTISNQVYGVGVYTCSESTDSATPAYQAMDGSTGTAWTAVPGTYPGTGVQPNPYVGSVSTTVGGTAVLGAWLQVQLPVPISVVTYTLTCTNGERGLSSFVLCGSLDGVTWAQVDTQSGFRNNYWGSGTLTFTPSNPQPYRFYRLVVTAKTNTGQSAWSYPELDEWLLYGTQPGNPLLQPTATPPSIPCPPMSEGVTVPTRDFFMTRALTVAIDSAAGTTLPLDDYDLVLCVLPIENS